MPTYTSLLFDLDGTLTDPALGITTAVAYAVEKMGFAPPPREKLLHYIGPPLKDTFMQDYHLSPAEGDRAVTLYREYFAPRGLFENQVYPGIPELLAALKARGIWIALATSKPEVFAKKILDHFDMSQYFDEIVGSELDGRRVKKAEVVAEVLSRCPTPDRALMVGDRFHDVEGAHQNHLPAAGVLYGYGSREEMEEHKADFILETVADLSAFLLEG